MYKANESVVFLVIKKIGFSADVESVVAHDPSREDEVPEKGRGHQQMKILQLSVVGLYQMLLV